MNFFKEHKILVPNDFSDASEEAIRLALRLAITPEDVHIAQFFQELPVVEPGVIWETLSDEKRVENVRDAMQKQLAEIPGSENVHLNVRIGEPGSGIADLAEELKVGLIVIPSHGRTGMSRFLLGSVAEKVVRLAKCPVLVLKNEDIRA